MACCVFPVSFRSMEAPAAIANLLHRRRRPHSALASHLRASLLLLGPKPWCRFPLRHLDLHPPAASRSSTSKQRVPQCPCRFLLPRDSNDTRSRLPPQARDSCMDRRRLADPFRPRTPSPDPRHGVRRAQDRRGILDGRVRHYHSSSGEGQRFRCANSRRALHTDHADFGESQDRPGWIGRSRKRDGARRSRWAFARRKEAREERRCSGTKSRKGQK